MKTAQALTFVLFVSLFQTSTTYVADSAPTTISKTIVVRDSSGNLYPGAQVQLAMKVAPVFRVTSSTLLVNITLFVAFIEGTL